MKRLVYDIEVFPNMFLAIIKNMDTGEYLYIEKSPFKDNVHLARDALKNSYLVGYNSIDYDNIVMNYVINDNPTTEAIYEFSNFVIRGKIIEEAKEKLNELYSKKDDNTTYSYDLFGKKNVTGKKRETIAKLKAIINEFAPFTGNWYDKVKPYKYNDMWEDIDLLRMLFSKKLRVGLKELEIMLKWHNVMESDIPFDQPIKTEAERREVIKYCLNDVDFTEHLAKYCKKDIQLRFDIQKQYGVNALSLDGVNLGAALYYKAIADKTGMTFKEVKNIRGVSKPFYLGEIINDFIHFTEPCFKALVEDIKKFKYIHRENYFSSRISYKNTIYDIGSGGLHAYFPHPMIFQPKENEFYWQIDAGKRMKRR